MRKSTGARGALVVGTLCAMIGTTEMAKAADEENGFGRPGTVALSGGLAASASKSNDGAGASVTGRSLGTGARADFFVARNFSLGLGGVFSYGKYDYDSNGQSGSSKSLAAGATARIGYYIPLGSRVGFWPIASAGFTHVHASATGSYGYEGSIKEIDLLATLVFHIDPGARGWFLTLTPAVVAYSTSNLGTAGALGAPSMELGFGGYF